MKSRKPSSKQAKTRKGGGRSGGKRGNMTPYEAFVFVAEEMKKTGEPIWIKPLAEVIRDLASA